MILFINKPGWGDCAVWHMTVWSVERRIVLPVTKISEEQACKKQINKQTFPLWRMTNNLIWFSTLTKLFFSHAIISSQPRQAARLKSHDLFSGLSDVWQKHFLHFRFPQPNCEKIHASHLVLSQPLCLEKEQQHKEIRL